jgi:hypothetical protein
MYYVIQRHHNNHKKHFFAYAVIKYIAAKNTKNIIFELNHNGVTKHKWSPKEDIILLTQDQELFRTTYERLTSFSVDYQEKIEAAQEELNSVINEFHRAIENEFELIKQASKDNYSSK